MNDNYNTRYGYSGTPVSESYSIDQGQNSCNVISIRTAQTTLNGEGMFEDRYTTEGQRIPACETRPDCVTVTTQTINVESQSFSHPVIWSCTNVEVQR